MLNNVPVWYELWRQFNGFPPEFYTPEVNKTSTTEKQPEKGKDEKK